MKSILIISLLILAGGYGFGQGSDSHLIFDEEWFNQDEELIKSERGSVDSNFIGGRAAFRKTFLNNLIYPKDAKDSSIYGTVYYEIEIDTNGFINRFLLLRAVYPSIDKEIKDKIFLTNGKWTPLLIDDKKVKYTVTESVKFSFH